jgi:hypothetical protein
LTTEYRYFEGGARRVEVDAGVIDALADRGGLLGGIS